MSRKTALHLSALLLGLVLSLGFLEVALRIYNPIFEAVRGDTITLRPNYDEVRHNTDTPGVAPVSHIHQNALGFRGADPPSDLTDRLSIITVGGSTTRDATQSDDRTWTALVGDAVANCFDRTWINNAGFEAQTSIGHAELIGNYISKLHPKVVVMLIGANELRADGLVLGPNDVSPNSGLSGFVIRLANRSAVIDLGVTAYRSFRVWMAGLHRGNPAEGDPMPFRGEERLTLARHLQPDYAERLRLIIRLLRAGATIPVLLTQPTVGGMTRDPTTGKDLSRLWYGEYFYRTFEIYNDTMRAVADSENVFLIDLARLMPKDTKYYWDPEHHTDAGVKKIAELVGAELLPYLGEKFPTFKKEACHMDKANPS